MESKANISDSQLKVGVFYHEEMLLHKSPNLHPENPERLTSILNHLQSCNLFQDCIVCNDFGTINRDILIDFHGERYVDFIENIWDETSNKEVRFYKDTYYNKHTPKVASLAANALKLAVDDVMSEKIQRAFALVRPPGHHAAANSGIGGFCIYNSVAVAAKYAIKEYNLKRIVIFDWDVHHGDGTSKFLYNDATILYISLHRFDKGTFYPGEFGKITNLGEGDGKGFNLNYPWDLPHPFYTVGDNEYIYALERIFVPVIKEFSPELLLISAGFDAACGDPLGGLDVSHDGYAYMTQRLMGFNPTKTIIGLEGGYNMDSISLAAEACLRILLGQQMPLIGSENELTFQEMKNKCLPNQVGLRTASLALETFTPYWPNINIDEEALEFEKIVKENVEKNFQKNLSNGTYIIKQNKFLRKASKNVLEMFETFKGEKTEARNSLLDFFPKYLDNTKINGESYTIVENLLFKDKRSSFLQVKFSPKKNSDHVENIEKANQSLVVSDFILKDEKGVFIEQNSFLEGKDSSDNINNLFQQFFRDTNKSVDIQAIGACKEFLEDLRKFIDTKNSSLWLSPSLLFIFDKSTKKFQSAWISFKDYEVLQEGRKDESFLEGINTLLNLLEILK